MRSAYSILVGKPEGKSHLEDLGVDGWVILQWERCGLDASSSEKGSVAGSCEHGNEPAGCIKGNEFLD
jgi:hypothetical protein